MRRGGGSCSDVVMSCAWTSDGDVVVMDGVMIIFTEIVELKVKDYQSLTLKKCSRLQW